MVRNLFSSILATLILGIAPTSSFAQSSESLRIGTWNIAYHSIISDRYVAGAEGQPADQRDIYTALVFAKDSFPEVPIVTTMDALSIQHIGFDRDGTPSSRPTRAGVMVDLEVGGQILRLLGIHLKSSCHRWSLDPIQDQNDEGRIFSSIVLGDFNRDMNAGNADGGPIDPFWTQLNDGTPSGLELVKGPLGIDEVCWPNHDDRFDDHIDFVIYDQALAGLATLVDPQGMPSFK